MKMNFDPADQNTLAEKLLEEAKQQSPDFSPSLHARIMKRVESSSAPLPMPMPANNTWMLRVAAVIILVIGAAALIRLFYPPVPAQVATKPPHDFPAMDLKFPSLTQATAIDAQYGYLDHDAKKLAKFVMNQFDVVPGKQG